MALSPSLFYAVFLKSVCGGSRSRAYNVTGDYMESEPYCVYIPKAMRQMKKAREVK
ncbi:hypothetical protein [Virgibacillus sp. CBA3643]|uniref:hypothetical protein n=1 Tax=Virgibacillus sp. CBA3643 TaxID=2942278 RepID=UPI0035A26D13